MRAKRHSPYPVAAQTEGCFVRLAPDRDGVAISVALAGIDLFRGVSDRRPNHRHSRNTKTISEIVKICPGLSTVFFAHRPGPTAGTTVTIPTIASRVHRLNAAASRAT
jgi:hypothetical protein